MGTKTSAIAFMSLMTKIYSRMAKTGEPPTEAEVERGRELAEAVGLRINPMKHAGEIYETLQKIIPLSDREKLPHPSDMAKLWISIAPNVSKELCDDSRGFASFLHEAIDTFLLTAENKTRTAVVAKWIERTFSQLEAEITRRRDDFETYLLKYNELSDADIDPISELGYWGQAPGTHLKLIEKSA